MKKVTKLFLLLTFALGSMAFGSMNGPTGLALDGKGNLYVSNFNSNVVQVYNTTSHNLTRTISNGISQPFGLAVDPWGNLHVANFGNGTVSSYDPKGNALGSITGLVNPIYIAADEVGELWVVDQDLSNLELYDRFGGHIRSQPASSFGFTTYYSVAEHAGLLSYGLDGGWIYNWSTTEIATQVLLKGFARQLSTIAVALVLDSAGNQWVAGSDSRVYVSADFYNYTPVTKLSYPPSGMAVDRVHNLVYLSDNFGNRVDVYTTAGVFVTSIQ